MKTRYVLDANTGLFTDRDGNTLGRVVAITIESELGGKGGTVVLPSTSSREENLEDSSRDGGVGETTLNLIDELWSYYQRVITEAAGWTLNPTRRRVIRVGLEAVGATKVKVSPDAPADDRSVLAYKKCCRAIDGLRASAWHNGDNGEGRAWLEIRFALKGNSNRGESNEERIEKMAALAPASPAPSVPGVSQDKIDRRIAHIRDWHRSGRTLQPGLAAQYMADLDSWGFLAELLDEPPFVRLKPKVIE